MKAWIAALACAGFVAGAGPETEAPASPEIVEAPGAPVLIESTSVALAPRDTTLVVLQARSATADVVDNFTARVDVLDADGKARGSVARSQGPVDPDSARYEVPLRGWELAKGDRLRVTVVMARVGNRTWAEGTWTEDPADMEIPQGMACNRDFCLRMSEACNVTCKKPGCILSFKCSMGPKSCDSECICRLNVICGGP